MAKKTSNKSARFANMLVLLIALLAAIVLVNVASVYLFGRMDLTENHVNSLSPESVEVLQSLTGQEGSTPLEVRVYISNNLPDSIKGDYGQEFIIRGVDQKFRDKLDEFETFAGSRMEIVAVTEDIEKQAESAGVMPFVSEEATVVEGKLEMTRYVLGATIHWEGEVEVYEKAIDPNFFEFEITKRLIRLKDRVENGRKIQHLTRTADDLWDALKTCDDEIHAFEVKEEDKQEISGIEGLLKPIENMEEEAQALVKNKDRIAEQCGRVKTLYDSRGIPQEGQNKRFDSFLKGDGGEGRIGAVAGYVKTVGQFEEVLATEKPDIQKVIQIKNLLTALRNDAEENRKLLKRSPGQRRIGFVCGHGEFCPFPSEKPVIDPKIAQMMGQNNPIHQRFIQMALGVQDQVNQVLMSIGQSLFRERDFDVIRVDANKTIRDDVAALVIFGPGDKLADRERYEIDQYLLRGGTVLVFARNFEVDLASFSEEDVKEMGPFNPNPKISNDYYAIRKTESNVDDVLAAYGVQLNQDLVVDALNNNKVTLPHSVRRGNMVIRGTKDFAYPMLVYAKDFDRTNVMVRTLPGLTLPFSSSLEYKAVEGQEVEVSELVKTAAGSVALMDPTSLPVKGEGETAEKIKLLPPELTAQVESLQANGPHTVALMVTGKFVSAFAGKDAPEKPPAPAPDPQNPEPPKEEKEPPRLDAGNGRLLVVGSALGLPPLTLQGVFKDVTLQNIQQGEVLIPQVRFENWKVKVNQFRRAFGETIPALFNMLDWAVQRSALAEIRAKNNAFRPIEQITEDNQKMVAYGAMAGLPLLFILFGLGYWQVRLARRRGIGAGVAAARPRAGDESETGEGKEEDKE